MIGNLFPETIGTSIGSSGLIDESGLSIYRLVNHLINHLIKQVFFDARHHTRVLQTRSYAGPERIRDFSQAQYTVRAYGLLEKLFDGVAMVQLLCERIVLTTSRTGGRQRSQVLPVVY